MLKNILKLTANGISRPNYLRNKYDTRLTHADETMNILESTKHRNLNTILPQDFKDYLRDKARLNFNLADLYKMIGTKYLSQTF